MNKMELRAWKMLQIFFGFSVPLIVFGVVSGIILMQGIGVAFLLKAFDLAYKIRIGYYDKVQSLTSMQGSGGSQ